MSKWIERPDGFVDVPGYEGLYAISENGQVYSYGKNAFWKGRLLKTNSLFKGYVKIPIITKEGKTRTESIHRMLMNTFKPREGSELLQVNHINGIRTDNRLDNLEWCTAKENARHAWSRGLSNVSERRPRSTYIRFTAPMTALVKRQRSELAMTYVGIARYWGCRKDTIAALLKREALHPTKETE